MKHMAAAHNLWGFGIEGTAHAYRLSRLDIMWQRLGFSLSRRRGMLTSILTNCVDSDDEYFDDPDQGDDPDPGLLIPLTRLHDKALSRTLERKYMHGLPMVGPEMSVLDVVIAFLIPPRN